MNLILNCIPNFASKLLQHHSVITPKTKLFYSSIFLELVLNLLPGYLVAKMPGKNKRKIAAEQRERNKRDSLNYAASMTQSHASQNEQLQNLHINYRVIGGTIHQGDSRFQYPGIQCTFISFWALAYMRNKDPLFWNPCDVDLCVIEGNKSFIQCCESLNIEPNMLLVRDLPSTITVQGNMFECDQKDTDIHTGTLNQPVSPDSTFSFSVSISEAIVNGFAHSNSCLLVCGGQTIAIAKDNNHFFIFDPHSRGKDGLLHHTGSAVLVVFSTIQTLISFIKRLFIDSLLLGSSEVFELVPIIISRPEVQKPKKDSHSISPTAYTNPESLVTRINEANCTNQILKNSNGGRKQNVASVQETVMQSYFADQEKRDKEYKEKINENRSLGTCKIDKRNKYMRQYMRSKREEETVRKKENASARIRMKKIYQTEEGKLKSKVRAAERKKTLRSTETGRKVDNERSAEAMRKRLSTEEGRKKHRERSSKGMKKILSKEEGRKKHKERSSEGMIKMLSTEQGRKKHKERSIEGMRKMLSTEEGRKKHKVRSIEGMRKMLSTEEGRKKT